MLIAHAGRILSIKLQASKEWGVRPVELFKLKVKDIDLEQHRVYVTTAKHGANRTIPITNNLTERLREYIYKYSQAPERPAVPRQRNQIRQRIQSIQKQLSRKTERSNNQKHQAIRLPTLLRNHAIPQNTRHTPSQSTNGSQTNRNNLSLHTTA
jgi:integrase